MIKFFEENSYDYTLLTHCPLMDGIIHHRVTPSTNTPRNDIIEFPDSDRKDATTFAHQRRRSIGAAGNQKMMMAVAWTIPSERHLFSFFPSVIMVDTTMDTNKEGRPYFSLVGKDTNGKTFTILRAYLPNQQAWVFRWLFCLLLPQVYGNHILDLVNLIVTDGDAQETSQLDSAIDQFFPNAKRARCGWHIIHGGWNRYVEGKRSLSTEQQVIYERIKLICTSWLYSFMKASYCETKEEYFLSKTLFKRFLLYSGNQNVTLAMLVTNIMAWFKNHVEVHENYYCYYRRRHKVTFGVYSNTPIEGTHNGMKSSATPVLPTHSLVRSVAVLSKNAERKQDRRFASSYIDVVTTRTYKANDELSDVIEYAYVTVQKCYKDSMKYISWKDSTTSFLVTRNVADHPYANLVHIPQFRRIRRVRWTCNKLVCDCPLNTTWELLCPHVIQVALRCNPNYAPNKTEISCLWWKSYMHYSHRVTQNDTMNDSICDLFKLLKLKQIIGATIDSDSFGSIPICKDRLPEPFVFDDKSLNCINYPSHSLSPADFVDTPGTMSQYSNKEYPKNDDNLSNDDSENEECCFQGFDGTDNSVTEKFEEILNDRNNSSSDPVGNPYGYLKMSFLELTDVMKGNTNTDELTEVKMFLNQYTNKIMSRVGNRNKRHMSGDQISSNVEYKRNRKSHGTSYF